MSAIRKLAPVVDVALSVYDLLRRDYRLWWRDITGSEDRGNASYPAPFSVDRKPTWLPDLREEMLKLDPLRRTDERARHAWLTVSDVERRISRALADLSDLDTDWSEDGVD